MVNQVQNVYNGLGQLVTQYQEHNGTVNSSASLKVLCTYADPNHGSRLTSITYLNGTTSTLTYSYGVSGALKDKLAGCDHAGDRDAGELQVSGSGDGRVGGGTSRERKWDFSSPLNNHPFSKALSPGQCWSPGVVASDKVAGAASAAAREALRDHPKP